MHPSNRIVGTKSHRLLGKKILLGITGSVAAFMSPQIARELMRHGAHVVPVMSRESQRLIGPDLMWWATANKPITEITGDIEHIRFAGVMNRPVDAFLIAPCTTNSLNKIATGIADTPVTLIAATLIGKGIPVIISYVGHEDLVNNATTQKNIRQLEEMGVKIIHPVRVEGKAKIPSPEELTAHIFKSFMPQALQEIPVIITGGPTREPIDNVRFVTNAASGRTAISLAEEAYLYGATPKLVLGPTLLEPPTYVETHHVVTTQEMTDTTLNLIRENPRSLVILSAAMADFRPKSAKKGKTKSTAGFKVELEPTEKLVDQVKKIAPESVLVIFKAEWSVDRDTLVQRAIDRMRKANADYVVANDLSKPGAGFGTETNHVLVINKAGRIRELKGLKRTVAQHLFEQIVSDLGKQRFKQQP